MDAPSVEDEQAFLCHPMKFTRDIKTAFTNGCGYLLHLQMEYFLACRVMATLTQITTDLVSEGLRMCMPGTAGKTLCPRGYDVEQVSAENVVALKQLQHF